jgi:hypothetical protein
VFIHNSPREAWIRFVLTISAMVLINYNVQASTIVFDNLGPSNTYGSSGYYMGAPGSDTNFFRIACDFYANDSGNLDELWTTMWSYFPSYPLEITLTTDGSGIPGDPIWSTIIINKLGLYSSVLHLDGLNGPQITAGHRYWLTAELPSPVMGHVHNWENNALGDLGSVASSKNGGPWQLYGTNILRTGMRIGVVPEPSTCILLGMGVMGLLAYAWQRRRC